MLVERREKGYAWLIPWLDWQELRDGNKVPGSGVFARDRTEDPPCVRQMWQQPHRQAANRAEPHRAFSVKFGWTIHRGAFALMPAVRLVSWLPPKVLVESGEPLELTTPPVAQWLQWWWLSINIMCLECAASLNHGQPHYEIRPLDPIP